MAFQTLNPYTEEVVATFDELTDAQIDAVIDEADRAFHEW